MNTWEMRDYMLERVQRWLPRQSDYVHKTLGVFFCYKNCLAHQLYIFGTSSESDKTWVYDRSFRYMKKVMLDWCDMKGIKDAIFARRNELLKELFAVHQPLLVHHDYLYQIDYSHLAAALARWTAGGAISNFVAARSLCNVLYNLEEYHHIWNAEDVRYYVQNKLNFYDNCEVWFDFHGLQHDGEFWDILYSTMGIYREKYCYMKSQFAFP
ncbi:hypothetical protein LOC68_10070 [Blastopirellula sp. JC732]|uniref:Uncharacterized protein n=1 Tax=Blastopirellula sediminis TaxID=2894196 RepID=A0A9X1MM20_9BACT|nr:hypothetical protein [Blastopirellula sediminis]MCC9608478.1 hypothetical protein [Blastopirellula sediminis]MCC9628745.1 hypothetical protein [Blastopirellula sediminis]